MQVKHTERCPRCESQDADEILMPPEDGNPVLIDSECSLDDYCEHFGIVCSKCTLAYRVPSITEDRFIELTEMSLNELAQDEQIHRMADGTYRV